MATPAEAITEYFDETDVKLRKFAKTLGPSVSWAEDEDLPVGVGDATVLIETVDDLEVEDGLTLGDKYRKYSPRRRFNLYVSDFEEEGKVCAFAEEEIQAEITTMTKSTKNSRTLAQKLRTAIDAAAVEVAEVVFKSELPPKESAAVQKSVLEAQSRSRELSRDLGDVRQIQKTASSIATRIHAWSPVAVFRWATTSKFVFQWVSAMNALLTTRPQHFTTTEFANAITMSLKPKLLPVYETDVLATTEKLSAIASLHLLTVEFAREAERVSIEKPVPQGGSLEDLGLQQSARALRAMYFGLDAYRKLALNESDFISDVMQEAVQNLLTIQYFIVFIRLSNRVINFDRTEVEDYWFWRVYEKIDWHEKIGLLGESTYDGIAAAVNASNEGDWDDEI